jgi:four helix bundle protein
VKIDRFEDLECWKEARKLVRMVYAVLNASPAFQKDFRLSGQMTGAAVSVMNNIAEGWASQSNAEFIRFLTYSRRSGAETQNCAYVAVDQAYVSEKQFEEIYNQALTVIRIIDGLLRYLRANRSPKRLQPPRPILPSKPSKLSQLSQPSKPS